MDFLAVFSIVLSLVSCAVTENKVIFCWIVGLLVPATLGLGKRYWLSEGPEMGPKTTKNGQFVYYILWSLVSSAMTENEIIFC